MSDWERVEEALNRLSSVSGEPDYSLAESAKEALFRMGSELAKTPALLEALRWIASGKTGSISAAELAAETLANWEQD